MEDTSRSKYMRFLLLVLILAGLVWFFGFEEDGTVKSGVRHFLKGVFRSM